MLTADIRSRFLDFFANNGHTIVESSPVVPQNDPSLLFTNAGMVQFKNLFIGSETRDYKRATTAQKCIRAGGKHNDLDQVGFTARHHTFFEMLGNFSFGDYFKEDAIRFAWQFLTRELGLNPTKLLVTIYHTDEEAASIWRKVAGNITIIPISTSDNFWSMGDTGPCGPCSEIFYDRGDSVPGGLPGSAEEDGDRYMEIWNIVFMQFNQLGDGHREKLGKPCIDTGMGLERIASVMQNVPDNYQIDLFRTIIDHIKSLSGTNFADTYPSYKVIADHIRSVSFLIADGVLPSNEGRGYVLRRILRRAMRHGNLIGLKRPFLSGLSKVLIDLMGDVYPELCRARQVLINTINSEEEKFLDTLERGLKILQQESIPDGGVLSGEKAFQLYDTYGFPLDLTQDILSARSITVDVAGFEEALQQQKMRAKWKGSGDTQAEPIWNDLCGRLPETCFLGYEQEQSSGKILAIVENSKEVATLCAGQNGSIITDQTPFYGECGGQCGDIGTITLGDSVFAVQDTQRIGGKIFVHHGCVTSGHFATDDMVTLAIDSSNRSRTRANHTATHLLHAALRKVCGEQVVQRGSLINGDKLRFDFSYEGEVNADKLRQVEDIINGVILLNLPVCCKEMPIDQAISAGAMALFGEKYSNVVRTVRIDHLSEQVSFELCGGTHVNSCGEIGLFKILSEGSVGSGVRRIEAVTGWGVLAQLRELTHTQNEIGKKLKCSSADIIQRINDLQLELKRKNDELATVRQRAALDKINIENLSDTSLYSIMIEDFSMDDLRALANCVRNRYPAGIVVLISTNAHNQLVLLISVSKNIQSSYSAQALLKTSIPDVKGGGNSAIAQGGTTGDAKDVLQKIILTARNFRQ